MLIRSVVFVLMIVCGQYCAMADTTAGSPADTKTDSNTVDQSVNDILPGVSDNTEASVQTTGTDPGDSAARAKEIMDYVDDLWRGVSSKATMSMHVKTERWERTITMIGWSLEKDYSLVRILSPKKEAGTATLKYEKNIYNYLPKTDRTIKSHPV